MAHCECYMIYRSTISNPLLISLLLNVIFILIFNDTFSIRFEWFRWGKWLFFKCYSRLCVRNLMWWVWTQSRSTVWIRYNPFGYDIKSLKAYFYKEHFEANVISRWTHIATEYSKMIISLQLFISRETNHMKYRMFGIECKIKKNCMHTENCRHIATTSLRNLRWVK